MFNSMCILSALTFKSGQSGPKAFKTFNPIQYGLFLKHYSLRGALWPPLVTLLFLKVEGQNLVGSGILMCFLQKWHLFLNSGLL